MSWHDWFFPQYSLAAQTAFRAIYAVVLFMQLGFTAISARRFFSTERYGGYLESSRTRDICYHPRVVIVAAGAWLLCTFGLFFDVWTFAAALANVAFCRYLLINTRWVSLSRGFGAVGHITLWTAVATMMLELSRLIDNAGMLRSAAVLAFRVDLGLIMIVAGYYKITAGYAQGNGWEVALVNPWWSYWSRIFRNLSPQNILFKFMNHMAYIVEIGAGTLMLTPLHAYGALAIAASFAMLGLNLRLTFLPEMVVVSALLFVDPGSWADRMAAAFFHAPALTPVQTGPAATLATVLAIGLWASIPIGILIRTGLFYNFFRRKRLPGKLQSIVDALASALLITLWRVFTADIIEFYIDVYRGKPDGTRELYSRQRFMDFARGLRFAHAGEFVALCTTFTTLKYFPDDPAIFERRILRYAKTVPLRPGESVIFRYMRITKGKYFQASAIAEFIVDPVSGTIAEQSLDRDADVRRPAPGSPVFKGSKVGSYAPSE